MEEIVIRHYRKEDRPFVRRIAWETALMGESAQAFFDGEEAFCDFLTLYFTDYEPQSCFIAQVNPVREFSSLTVCTDSGIKLPSVFSNGVNGNVAGYLLGARDNVNLERVFRDKIILPLLFRAFTHGVFFRKKNLVFFFNFLKSLLRKEFKIHDFSREYPATLHINLQKRYRDSGIGSKLISAFLEYLLKSGVRGVQLATMSEKAGIFFQKQGFNLLYEGKRSYLRHLLHRDIPIYIYAKKL